MFCNMHFIVHDVHIHSTSQHSLGGAGAAQADKSPWVPAGEVLTSQGMVYTVLLLEV